LLLLAPVAVSQNGEKQDPKKDPKQEAKKVGNGKLMVSWHGQSFFSVTTPEGKVFVFDPHNIPEYGRIEPMKPDVIMISHNHNDHTQIGIFENAQEKGDKAPEIIQGLKREEGRETWNPVDKDTKGAHIKSIGAYHDEVQGMKHGKITMFVLEVDGWRICHLGDLGHKLNKKQLEAIGKVDVLMVPCGGIYGLNGSEARDVVNQIKPREFILPMHIGTVRYTDLLPVDEFIEDNPLQCAVVRDGKLIYNKDRANRLGWLREESKGSDNTLVLERDPNRKGPVIVNLHYWPQVGKKKT